jgi:hypothetical protein
MKFNRRPVKSKLNMNEAEYIYREIFRPHAEDLTFDQFLSEVNSLHKFGLSLMHTSSKVIWPVTGKYYDSYPGVGQGAPSRRLSWKGFYVELLCREDENVPFHSIGGRWRISPRQRRWIPRVYKKTTRKGRPKREYLDAFLPLVVICYITFTSLQPTMGSKDGNLSNFEEFAVFMLKGHPIADKRRYIRVFLSKRNQNNQLK